MAEALASSRFGGSSISEPIGSLFLYSLVGSDRRLAEGDGAVVEAVDDCEALHAVAHAAELVASALEGFLDDKSEPSHLSSGLVDEVEDALGGVAVSHKVVDYEHAVACGEEVGADTHSVVAVFGE